MKSKAIDQARARLEKCNEAISKMESSASFEQFEAAWSDFLLAAAGVYSKLEQGAKGVGSSEGWFGRKKNVRKNDELLRYIHHARNADEHGLDQTTEKRDGSTTLASNDGAITANVEKDAHGNNVIRIASVTQWGPKAPEVITVPAHPVLVAARDSKHGDVFQPPTEHLGAKLQDASPLNVARTTVAYLTTLISEAAQLASGP